MEYVLCFACGVAFAFAFARVMLWIQRGKDRAHVDTAGTKAQKAWHLGQQSFTFQIRNEFQDQVAGAVSQHGWHFVGHTKDGRRHRTVLFMRPANRSDR